MAQVAVDGPKLKQIRLAKGVTSEELAEKSGVSERALLEIESGGRREGIREKTLFAVCKALGIEPGDLCPAAAPVVPASHAPAEGGDAGKKTA